MNARNEAAEASENKPVALSVHNGTYTVQNEKRGHFTVKLHTVRKGNLAGKRLLSLLVGPNNETDFKAVAFWDDEKRQVYVWQKHKGPESRTVIDGYEWQKLGWSAYEQKLAIWADLAIRGTTEERHGFWYSHDYRLLLEGRCVVCNKKLTTPESIQAGIGPVCAGRS